MKITSKFSDAFIWGGGSVKEPKLLQQQKESIEIYNPGAIKSSSHLELRSGWHNMPLIILPKNSPMGICKTKPIQTSTSVNSLSAQIVKFKRKPTPNIAAMLIANPIIDEPAGLI
jgi:hypothetical protein